MFMLNSIYTFSFILSFCYLFVLISAFRNRVSAYFIMLFAGILITNFGYMQMADAETLKMAVYANQTIYLGSSFTSFFLFMCLADLCKEKIPTWVQTCLITYGAVLFFFASSIGLFDLYYKSVELTSIHGISYLNKIYGPFHLMYPVYLMGTLGGGLFIIIKSFFNHRRVSYQNNIMLLISMVITVLAYGLEKKVVDGFPLIPIAYDISQTFVLILITRISRYDVGSIASDVIVETAISGIICFDTKGRFLGADDDCTEWFPETQDLKIDFVMNPKESDFLQQISKWISGEDKTESVVIKRGDKFFLCEHSLKKENKIRYIHCIFIRDDSAQQNYTKEVEKQVREKTKKINKMQRDVIIGMASFVEDRDNNTGGHIQRTSEVVNIFVNHLRNVDAFKKITPTVWHNIVKAAPLHDVGKIGVPDNILNKPGKFTDEEYEIMKTHAARGAINVEKILRSSEDVEFKKTAVNVAHYHHEKWNGSGYPEKISGIEIPFEARVMALADVFDALVSKRVYKDSFSFDKAFSIIEESSGSHFDPELCREFLNCRQALEEFYKNSEGSSEG